MRKILGYSVAALVLWTAGAAAEQFRVTFKNETPGELIQIEMELKTTRGIRHDRTRVLLQPDDEYRIGIDGAIEPLRITVQTVDALYDFTDFSALNMLSEMSLSVCYSDGEVFLRQPEYGREVKGELTKYLTDDNRNGAVDWETIIKAKNMNVARRIINAAVGETGIFTENDGKVLVFPVAFGFGVEMFGVGRAIPVDNESLDAAISLRVPMEPDIRAEILMTLLRLEYRPLISVTEKSDRSREENKYVEDTAQDAVTEVIRDIVFAMKDESVRDFAAKFVGEATWQEVLAGKDKEDITPAPGVVLLCSRGTIDVIFLPDCVKGGFF